MLALHALMALHPSLMTAPRRSSARSSALTTEGISRGIRFHLQLGMEWETDRAAYEDGASVLAKVSQLLEAHFARRLALRRKAKVAGLVDAIMERLKGEPPHPVDPITCFLVAGWLLDDAGIELTVSEVKDLLEQPVLRRGARTRTRREHLVGKLAQLLDTSPSDLEKVLTVIERGKETPGRLANVALYERAASDAISGPHEALLFAMHSLDVDSVTGEKIAEVLSREQIEQDFDNREGAATLLEEGQRAKGRRARKRASKTSGP